MTLYGKISQTVKEIYCTGAFLRCESLSIYANLLSHCRKVTCLSLYRKIGQTVKEIHLFRLPIRERPEFVTWLPLASCGFDASGNFCFAPYDPEVYKSVWGGRCRRGRPIGLVNDQLHCFVAFPPGAVVAISDADETVSIGFEQSFGSRLSRLECGACTHRFLGGNEYRVLPIYRGSGRQDTIWWRISYGRGGTGAEGAVVASSHGLTYATNVDTM